MAVSSGAVESALVFSASSSRKESNAASSPFFPGSANQYDLNVDLIAALGNGYKNLPFGIIW
jgi:hypothetical protein